MMRLASPGFGVRDCATRLVLCLAATIAALSPACFAQAQTNYEHTLACVLHDLAGRPLSGVAIELRSVSPPLEKIRALTGSDGSFTFDGLREGEYSFRRPSTSRFTMPKPCSPFVCQLSFR